MTDHHLVKGKYSCKIAYRKHEINRNPKMFNVGRLTEHSVITNYQQLGKEFEKIQKERVGEKLTHVDEK
jgi:hypothetical protein